MTITGYSLAQALVARRRFELLSTGFFSVLDPEPAMHSRTELSPLTTTLPGYMRPSIEYTTPLFFNYF